MLCKLMHGQTLVQETSDFRLYFQPNDSAKVNHIIDLLTRNLVSMQRELNYYTNNTIDVYFENSDTKNAAPIHIGAGVVKIKSDVIRLEFRSNIQQLTYSFRSQLGQILVEEMMYGGNLNDRFKSVNLMHLPDWLLPGLYHYLGSGWSVADDNDWRAAYERYGFNDFNALPVYYNQVKGASFWRFIHSEFGPSGLPSYLYMLRLTRKMSAGLYYAFQLKTKEVHRKWAAYYNNLYEQEQNRLSPVQGITLAGKSLIDVAVINDTLFYTLERTFLGCTINKYSGSKHRKLKLNEKRFCHQDSKPFFFMSSSNDSVSWGWSLSDTQFVISVYSAATQSIVSEGYKTPSRVSQGCIYNGEQYVLCQGWNSSTIHNLNDIDFDKIRVQGSVTSFDVSRAGVVLITELDDQFQLKVIPNNSKSESTIHASFKELLDVIWVNDSVVIFNSASNGIINGKVVNIASGKVRSVTNYRFNIWSHQYNNKVFAEVLAKGEDAELFIANYLPLSDFYYYDKLIATVSDLSFNTRVATSITKVKADSIDSLLTYTFQIPVNPAADYMEHSPDSLLIKDLNSSSASIKPWKEEPELLPTEMHFGLRNSGECINEYGQIDAFNLQGPQRFNIDGGVEFSNLLGTRKLTFGLTGFIQRGAFDAYGAYSYITKSDWRYDVLWLRRKREQYTQQATHKFLTNIAQVNFRKPLALKGLVIKNQLSLRLDNNSELVSTFESLQSIENRDRTGIIRGQSEISFHKSETFYSLELSAAIQPGVSLISKGYNIGTNVNLNYEYKLRPNVLIKTRGAFHNSFGSSPVFYLLGGSQSDVLSRFASTSFADYKEPILYQNIAGVRGFPLNFRNGNTVLYQNAQVDFHFIKALFSRPISSETLSRLHLRTFIDYGTTYYGKNIYDKANVLSRTQLVTETGSVSVLVNGFRNPFIASSGVGLGSQLYGYHLSLDFAVGIENQVLQPYATHFSIGLHF